MKKILILAALCSLSLPLLAKTEKTEETKLSEQEMLHLINETSGGVELYHSADIPIENRNQFDVNEDGIPEWFIVPKTACGDTGNCSFFVIMNEKKKGWRIVLKGDGKLTSLSPWGVIILPHKTKGYTDLMQVFDMGPEKGERSLERTVYVWDGKNYVKSGEVFPPPDASADLLNFMKEVDKLKRERSGGVKPQVQ